ncbi:hypothetical protein FPV67DRAFT_1475572 [Lyophyllum atratum]|nr:hypothetical protein FPV67DRAFT_1475572 [Lyophyllum atratum]
MGFLKRIFSFKSKNKKQRPQIVHNADARLRAIEEEEHETAVDRLLRSSSSRFAVVSEVDYASLPPLPHPINNVIQPPAASTISLASSTISQRGTYHVTVHKRKQHSLTEFPYVNRDCPDENMVQSKDTSQLLELRSHPSVASLLDMYDEHGRIPAQAFSNSPEKAERVQTRRNGSTLRQLLGEPPSLNSRNSNGPGSMEGDISWAERFLGETDSVSSAVSSLDLPTPRTPNTHFNNHSQSNNDHHDLSFITDHDLSTNTYENPAISSMEVELSIADSFPSTEYTSKKNNPYTNPDPATPQRASQVFGFLTERRRSKYVEDPERSLPELPSVFSVSSDEGSPGNNQEGRSHFSDDSFDVAAASTARPAIPSIPPYSDTFPADIDHTQRNTPPEESQYSSRPSQTTFAYTSERVYTPAETLWEAPKPRKRGNTINAPTRVIVTAPTPSGKHDTPSRIPRGPRAQSRRMSTGSNRVLRASTLAERSSNHVVSHSTDPFTPVLPKHRSHRRTSSSGSKSSSTYSRKMEIGPPIRLQDKGSRRRESGTRSILTELNKENGAELSVKATLPSTPLRSKSDSKSLFRAAVTPAMFRPPVGMTPSPASSSELSPVGKQLMMNMRQQRSRAREVERQKKSSGKFSFRTSRI